MSETIAYVRASRAKVLRLLAKIPNEAKRGGPADPILINAGHAASKEIVEAFLVKSRGGTDEAGDRWAPLSPATILKRRRKLLPTANNERPSSALSVTQRDKWWALYRSALAHYHDKGIAARVAWSKLKKVANVRFDKYGAAFFPILRDTDALLTSFVPGATHNIFRVWPGEVELGTSKKGAGAHHKGAKNLPQRRLWPEPRKWSSAWWQAILIPARDGLVEFIVAKLHHL